MLNLIKTIYKVGDKLNLTCVNGDFSGEILAISDDAIMLRTFEGRICGIKGSNISFFGDIETPTTIPQEEATPISQETETASPAPQSEAQKEPIEKDTQDESQPTATAVPSSDEAKQIEADADVEVPSPQIETSDKEQPKYKPGDVIPLDVLHRIDPKTKESRMPKKPKPQTLIGFESLGFLVEDEHRKQNEKYVPAIGTIRSVRIENNHGFIDDGRTGKRIFFRFNQIVDSNINKNSGYLFKLPVVYSIVDDNNGQRAITIHKPDKICNLIQLAQNLANDGNIKHAIGVLDHILSEYPDNFSADELKTKLLRILPKPRPKVHSTNLYFKAKQYDLAKDYPKAIACFIDAIEAGIKIESSIKDLGSLYAKLYTDGGDNAEDFRQKAIQLMDNYRDKLPDSLSTLNYLEGLYYSIQYYDAFIDVARDLLEREELINDDSRSSLLLCKIAAAYIHVEDLSNASKAIDEALIYDPNNVGALKLQAALENNNAKDIIDAISATEFESLYSGLSIFIKQTLDEYDEYAGVPAKVIESGDFSETTLKSIRGLIDRFSGRSRDRAKYLLTEAKLMQDIEPENMLRFRSILGRYCNDMAKTHIADNSSLDVIRFFYYESFSLEEDFDINARSVAYALVTHVYDYRELLQVSTRGVPLDTALKTVIGSEFDMKRWLNILTMFLFNRVISAKLTSLFFSNSSYKESAIKALRLFGVSINDNPTKEEFTEAWNTARETLKRYNSSVVASIRATAQSSTLEEILQQIFSLNDLKKDWMFPLDINRLYTIINNLAPSLSTYIKSSGFRNKEANRNNVNGQINQLLEDITNEPTKLSYEEFIPLLDSLKRLLSESFDEVVKMSEPRINIKLLSEQTVINDNGIVKIQLEVSNHKESSPIKEVSISIAEREGLKIINGDEVFYNLIEGGESHIFKLQFKAGEDIIQQKATAITINCNYKSGNENKIATSLLSLKLYSQDEFKPIENPYAPVADGGPVPLDSNMFFGREIEIQNIVDAIIKAPSKQIIIYGQKRSGKSSVMYRLKERLLSTGKTFCVLFSLGDIVNNLTEASFYYKIVSSIKQELDFLEIEGAQSIPPFNIPSAKEFKEEDEDNPLNTFSKYMIEFKLACKQTVGWENRNLVVMIDEFTYLYTEIKQGNISPSIMKQWKAITQNDRAQFSVVLVGQDVVPSFKKEDYARNAFGVIQDMRLTYLKDEPARALIETPILDENGHSRYIGEAVSCIIEYTSRNPYYIQIFCSRLVDYMNKNKSISVTEADVNEVARSFIYGSEALEEDKFDNLIRAGESEDLQEHSETDILAILRQIALNSKNIGYCNRSDINVLGDEEKENAILKDLYDREVLEMKGEDNYKIQVKLFQEWLLNH